MSVDYYNYVFYGQQVADGEDIYNLYEEMYSSPYHDYLEVHRNGGYQNDVFWFLSFKETEIQTDLNYGEPYKRLKELTPEDRFAYNIVLEKFFSEHNVQPIGEPGWYTLMIVS